ncbi:MAG: glycosyl transferase family 2 [Clostridia bacterium]|nr:glycosyl transferase family 2 [Clostridia bacterium]
MYKRLVDVLQGREDNYLLPFYWQHGDHRDKIPEQIERIYKSGCRALCVESRPHKDFCGPDWWADMDIIISECKARDMKIWILDDDHFPTGHANGAVKAHPEMRKWMLYERHTDVAGPLDDALMITEDEGEDHILIGAYIYPRTDKGEGCLPEPIDVKARIKDGFLHFSVPEGVYRIFFFYKSRRGASHNDYVDMIRPGSVRLLIDAVYEPHYARYKEHFGKTVAGFFSDEPFFGNTWSGPHSTDPGMYTHTVGMPGLALPYNERVLDMMKDALGYDPLPYFPALWFYLGEKTGDVRHAYMDAVTKLYRDCFTRQLGDWCEAHGVQYIGHIIEDMNAHARLGCSGGHYFRSLDGQHMSGIDIVLHQMIPGLSDHIHTASTFGNNADPEFFDYVLAKLASSFAHIGTQTKNRAMCEVFGAYGWAEGTPLMKWLIDHLLVRGVNRFVPHAFSPQFPDPDCPPHFGAEGVDPQFEGFTKLMDYTNRAAHLLSGGVHRADAAILYHADAEWYNGVGGAMLTQVPAKTLCDEHIDFDILPADCFINAGSRVFEAAVKDNTLCIGKQRYKCLIVPAAKKLPEKLEKALSDLQNKGLAVIRMTEETTKDDLISAFDKCSERDIKVDGDFPYLRCVHYTDGSAEIYMFVNESVAKPVKTSVFIRSANGIKRGAALDMLNDKKYAVALNGGKFELDLSPYQSVIAVFDRGDEELDGLEPESKVEKYKKAELLFKIETAPYTDMDNYTVFADGVSSDELPDITPGFSGRIRYTCKFEKPEGVCGIDLGFAGQTTHLFCSGVDLGVRICPPYSYDLSTALREGENEMVIEVSNTLANALHDGFSAFLPIPASGLKGPVEWLKKIKNYEL